MGDQWYTVLPTLYLSRWLYSLFGFSVWSFPSVSIIFTIMFTIMGPRATALGYHSLVAFWHLGCISITLIVLFLILYTSKNQPNNTRILERCFSNTAHIANDPNPHVVYFLSYNWQLAYNFMIHAHYTFSHNVAGNDWFTCVATSHMTNPHSGDPLKKMGKRSQHEEVNKKMIDPCT